MKSEQQKKFDDLRKLHEGPGAFVMPNPWDAGSARILTALGFQALATTSAGFAFGIGKRDEPGNYTRDELLANARAIVEATHLPVCADLQEGFGPRPEDCAATIRAAHKIGLVGGSIEDASGDAAKPIYDFNHSVERVAAAVEAARHKPFLLTARAENYLHARPDLDDTIRRLQAFSKAGAQVLYAPGLTKLEEIRTLCAAVDKPVNVVMGLVGAPLSVAELQEAGVRRISIGGSFARAALGALIRAAREVKEKGTFTYSAEALPTKQANDFMG